MPSLWIALYLILELSLPAALITPTDGPKGVSYKYFHEPFETKSLGVTFQEPTITNGNRRPTRTTHNPHHLKSEFKQSNLWTKLEDYSLKRYLRNKELTNQDNSLVIEDDVNYRKSKRKDNFRIARKKLPTGVTYYILSKEKNPYFKLLNAVNVSSNFNTSQRNIGNIRVWKKHVERTSKWFPSANFANQNDKSNTIHVLNDRNSITHEDDVRNAMKERRKMTGEIDVTSDSKDLVVYGPTTETSLGVAFVNSRVEMIKRFRREVADPESASGSCKKFVEGLPDQQMFFSPGFPDNYPNQTDCVVVLSARAGQLIRLDFRDDFNIEPSEDCRFDFLEVRDGAHGYSPQIGQYCGRDYPPLLTSQGRYLWLHFHSDDNIEYGGFTAVYEFIPRPTTTYYQPEPEVCRIEVDGNEGYINKSDIDPERIRHTVEYGIPLDCMWIITVDKDKKIMLAFKKFDLKMPNDCDSNFVDVFSNRTDLPSRLKNFCGSIADSVESSSNVLHIRFMAEAKAINSSFEALFTAFREKGKDKACLEDEYDCEDNTCISDDLRCNGRINCRFKWDEDECHKGNGSAWMQSEHIIIIMVVFSLILTGMSAAFLFSCIRKLISDHRIIQEHIRQSREGNLDDLGRLPTKVSEPVSKISLKHDSLSPKTRSDDHLENIDCYVPGVGEILPILLQGNKRERSCGETTSLPHNASMNNRDNEIIVRQQSSQRQDPSSSDREKDFESDDLVTNDIAGSGIVPEMCDSSCQTRESLFHTPAFSQPGSDRSFSPAPPSVDYSRKPGRPREQQQHSSDSSVRPTYQQGSTPFSTFGYSGSTVQRGDSRSQGSKYKDPRYKAEAVIEMENFDDEGNHLSDPNRNVDNKKQFEQEDRNRNKMEMEQFSKTPTGDRSYQRDDNQHYDKMHAKKRPYSVETTKSAPDVIIMTKSH